MKWNNRGHEFDEFGLRWSKVEGIFIYGASETAKAIYNMLRFTEISDKLNIRFVDSKFSKQKSGFCEREVVSPPQMLEFMTAESKYVIVDCTANSSMCALLSKHNTIQLNYNLFTYGAFKRTFLPVFLWYKFKKAFCSDVGIEFSTRCNLNCKGCMIFTDKHCNQKDRSLDMVCRDFDLAFSKFDYVWQTGFFGGEPLLYANTSKVMDHVSKYAAKTFGFSLTSNATIPLSDALLDSYRNFYAKSPYTCWGGGGASLYLDDYSENVKHSRPQSLYQVCRENGINAVYVKYSNWIDTGVGVVDHSDLSEAALTGFHDICDMPCFLICDGKFYTCSMVKSSVNAALLPNEENNYIDLETCSIPEFLEFQSGYSQKGYFELCKQCGGHVMINRNEIRVAEQCPRQFKENVF